MSDRKRKQKCGKLQQKFVDSDRFSQSFTFNLDGDGTAELPSAAGALLGILIFVLLVAYAGYKMDSVVQRLGFQLTTTQKEDFFGPNDVFGSKQGLAVAFQIIGSQLDPSYGSLSVKAS